jgi:hypothetical protein
MMKTIKAMTKRAWITPPTWKAKNPRAHRITRMTRMVSSIVYSFLIPPLLTRRRALEVLTFESREASHTNAVFMPAAFVYANGLRINVLNANGSDPSERRVPFFGIYPI